MTSPAILVVDDEPLARRRAIRLLKQFIDGARIEEAGDVLEARAILEARSIDVMLLDVQLPGGNGFTLLESLQHPPPAVILVTAFSHHALQAFEARAIDYVTKPIEPGRLQAALKRAMQAVEARSHQDHIAELLETVQALREDRGSGAPDALTEFWIRVRNDYVRVPVSTIMRFQADRDYVRIHAGNEIYLHHESLVSLERRLNPREFIRIHRSTIVKRKAIIRLKSAQFAAVLAVLDDGSELRVGRTYAPRLRASFSRAS